MHFKASATSFAAMDTPVHYLALPEGRLAFELHGEGPLVIAVPGMGDLRTVYRDLLAPIVTSGHRVALLDLRGHGDSDTTFAGNDDVETGRDILALIEHLGGPAVVIGNSMGASAAAWAAAERPSAVNGLVLLGPFLREPPTSRAKAGAMKALYRILFARPWGAALWATFYRSLNKGRTAPWLAEHVAAIRRSLRDPARLRSLRGLALALDHSLVEARLGEIATPSLVMVGDHDPDFADPAAELAWISDQLAGTMMLVDDSGHYVHAQRPDIVAPAVTRFLDTAREGTRG